MFKTVLYPTDFSDVSKKALDYIKQLKGGGAETVIPLHVVDKRSIQAIEQYDSAQSLKLEHAIMEDASQELEYIEQTLKNAGFKVKPRLEIGVPLTKILAVEKEENVSVIVIGSHGKSNLEEMFMGSVSEKVVRKCKRPIMVIKR
jgi:nucleotide-binding universal stress UspA family protein